MTNEEITYKTGDAIERHAIEILYSDKYGEESYYLTCFYPTIQGAKEELIDLNGNALWECLYRLQTCRGDDAPVSFEGTFYDDADKIRKAYKEGNTDVVSVVNDFRRFIFIYGDPQNRFETISALERTSIIYL